MFCHECGKQNPNEAKFCAFCGTRLIDAEPVIEQAVEQPPIEPPKPEPVIEPAKAEAPAIEPIKVPDPHHAYRRPAGDDVRPITENPAQPDPPVKKQAPRTGPSLMNITAKQPAVTASGGSVVPPARASLGTTQRQPVTHRPPAAAPYTRAQKPAEDLFFEDDDEPVEEEDAFVGKLKIAVAILLAVLVAGLLSWLFLMESGQLFRASFRLGAPATAYNKLGDKKAAEDDWRAAALAYHDALTLETANYEYAMKTAQAYDKARVDNEAIKAYQHCIKLRDNDPLPYKLLAETFERLGNPDAGKQWRQTGYEKTGDKSLLLDESGSDIVPAMP